MRSNSVINNVKDCFRFDWSDRLLKQKIEFDHYDAVKGILILLIVVGHARSRNPVFLEFQRFLYNFHAPLFLLIAFILPAPQFSLDSIRKRLRRYFVPVIWFSILAFIMFNILLSNTAIEHALLDFGLAFLTGSYWFFDKATGFEAFWFMHALFGVFFLRSLSGAFGWKSLASVAIFVGLLVLVVLPAGPHAKYLPTIFTISTYCLFISIPVYFCVNLFDTIKPSYVTIFVCGVALCLISYLNEHIFIKTYNIAYIRMPGFSDMSGLLIYILLLSTALWLILWAGQQSLGQKIFKPLGKLSFEIYLIHLFVFIGLERLFLVIGVTTYSLLALMLMIITGVIVSYALASVTRKLPFFNQHVFVK